MPTLSVCVPTTGERASLRATLDSILSQIQMGDQLIVDLAEGRWGYPGRNRMGQMALNDFLLFMDDDDIYLPGAFEAIRNGIGDDRESLHIFRGEWTDREPLWRNKTVVPGNVSTQLVAVPNEMAHRVPWGSRYAGDFDFIVAIAAQVPVVWHEEIICRVDPKGP